MTKIKTLLYNFQLGYLCSIAIVIFIAINYNYIGIIFNQRGDDMRLRKQALGDRNIIGNKVQEARKKKGMKQKELLAQLQVRGVDMNASGLSKLEGQIRYVTDIELVALADILEVSVDYLLDRE